MVKFVVKMGRDPQVRSTERRLQMKTNEYVSDRGERFCVLPPKAGDPIRGAPSPSSPEIIYDMRVTVKGIEKNLKALCAAHKKIGWTLDNFEDDLQVIRRVIDTATSDENAARRAALLLQKEVDELANNTCLPFMKMWDLMCELEVIPLQLKTREADISDDFCVDLFEKTRREMGLFDAFVEADLLLVRMPALPSIRAHGAVVNGRKMVIYDTQMFVEKVRGAVLSVEDSLPKIARKCVTYVFIYNSLTAPCLDSDNHATKAITDEICSHFEGGDDGYCTDFRFYTRVSETIPAGTYVTISPMEGSIPTPESIIKMWELRQRSGGTAAGS